MDPGWKGRILAEDLLGGSASIEKQRLVACQIGYAHPRQTGLLDAEKLPSTAHLHRSLPPAGSGKSTD